MALLAALGVQSRVPPWASQPYLSCAHPRLLLPHMQLVKV